LQRTWLCQGGKRCKKLILDRKKTALEAKTQAGYAIVLGKPLHKNDRKKDKKS